MGNSGFADLGEGLLIFDTFLTPQAAEDLRSAAETITGKQILYAVNSHEHGDHVRGNQVFSDVPIISTDKTRKIIKESLSGQIAQQKQDGETFLASMKEKSANETDPQKKKRLELLIGTITEINESLLHFKMTLPTVCCENDLVIHCSKRKALIKTWGGGHSKSDSVLLLPDDKITFAGNLLFFDTHLALVHGNAVEWSRSLNELSKYDIETHVPGHGPIGNEHHFELNQLYLTDTLNYCNKMVKEGVPAEEAASGFELFDYAAEWESKDTVPSTIWSVYEQLKK
ncbi:MBL fold metallo-hydrolase [Alkalihalobacillus sp. AL-G]|uniref:MBL fold metallo-hydrolase n=1 Tax=Alkalihalobacillus sp. AL-G TaxID=2926399 RepID=UPI00272D5742|nr:MBL fold metallo-hydrolase [Alkalihalobacillus sp. AL-G]WLD94195.1 MBL fold metallo-hydrolase [Alkalihalobacillus sp. AL-G]